MSANDRPVTVIDMDSAHKVGDEFTVLARFQTLWEAEQFIDQYPDQDKVERGGLGLDAPEALHLYDDGGPCCIAWVTSQGRDHVPDCPEGP